jgi:2-polyprenyl-6-hydroxyphenyl methylase/3-demethylubiquinone-9 3-methyltransferase
MRPGGIFLWDTINRTLKSRLIVIKVMQEWRFTRITDTAIHDWSMFIDPAELAATLQYHGLRVGEMTGLAPRAALPTVLGSFISANRGRISYGELSRRLDVGQVRTAPSDIWDTPPNRACSRAG